MDDLFAPPDVDWQRVSPALARMRRVDVVVSAVVAAVVLVVADLLLLGSTVLAVVAVVVVLVAAGWGWWFAGRNARLWGYAEREEDLWVTRGALVRRLVVVPYGRMQLVDVTVGPLERLFGIATVQLHTASPATDARIPGLPPDEAARLRDRLTELGEAEQAGL